MDPAGVSSIISREQQLPIGAKLGREGLRAMEDFSPLYVRSQEESNVSRGYLCLTESQCKHMNK